MQTGRKGRVFGKSRATLAQAMQERDFGKNPGQTGRRKANVCKHAKAVRRDAGQP